MVDCGYTFRLGKLRVAIWLRNHDILRRARCIDIGLAFDAGFVKEGALPPMIQFYKHLLSDWEMN